MKNTSLKSLKNFLSEKLGMKIDTEASESEVVDAMEQYEHNPDAVELSDEVKNYLNEQITQTLSESTDIIGLEEKVNNVVTAVDKNTEAIETKLSKKDVEGMITESAYNETVLKEKLEETAKAVLDLKELDAGDQAPKAPSQETAGTLEGAKKELRSEQETVY